MNIILYIQQRLGKHVDFHKIFWWRVPGPPSMTSSSSASSRLARPAPPPRLLVGRSCWLTMGLRYFNRYEYCQEQSASNTPPAGRGALPRGCGKYQLCETPCMDHPHYAPITIGQVFSRLIMFGDFRPNGYITYMYLAWATTKPVGWRTP